MDIDVFSADELDGVFRVLRTAPQRAIAARRAWREEARVDGANRRKRLVQLASIAALFSSPCAGST